MTPSAPEEKRSRTEARTPKGLFEQFVEARALSRVIAEVSRSGELIITPEKAKYIKDYLECRTAAKGGRVLQCQGCGSYAVVYNACNRRGCPVCSRKNQLNWQERMKKRLIPNAHHHLVFSVPEVFTEQWMKQPRATVAQLLKGVRKVIAKLENQRKLSFGTILVFQSHCRGLAYKAHVHCLISSGGMDEEDKWQPQGVLPLAKMTKWLKQALGGTEEQKGWQIYETQHKAGGEKVVEYLGERLYGSVVSAKELVEEVSGKVKIKARAGMIDLSPAKFVMRYLNHIPQKGTVLVRSCGLYSNRQKDRVKKAREQLGEVEKVECEKWEEKCPLCKAKMMTIVNSRSKVLEFEQERLGFGVDPPEHWEVSKAV